MRFYGAQPISIERKHLERLSKYEYRVCVKTDGTRSFLISDESGVYLLNRAMQKTPFTGFRLSKESVLDGELTADGKSFIIHDGMVLAGKDISHLSLTKRLEELVPFIKSCPKVSGRVKIKEHLKLSEMNTIDPVAPGADGLIFTPVNEPVRTGTHETLFKWKPLELNTVDFLWSKGALWVQGPTFVEKAVFQAPEGSIVECSLNNGHWIPIKFRTDKNYPNNKRTFERTLVNIREDIKFSELVKLNASGPEE